MLVALAFDVMALFQAIHQFYYAMVLDLQPLSNFAHGGPPSFWHALHRQHELILFWLQPGLAGRPAPPLQKAFELMAKLSQGKVFVCRQVCQFSSCCCSAL